LGAPQPGGRMTAARSGPHPGRHIDPEASVRLLARIPPARRRPRRNRPPTPAPRPTTRKETRMTDNMGHRPTPVHRLPTAAERRLMRLLAIADTAESIGCTHETAADALDRLNAAGRVRLTDNCETATV